MKSLFFAFALLLGTNSLPALADSPANLGNPTLDKNDQLILTPVQMQAVTTHLQSTQAPPPKEIPWWDKIDPIWWLGNADDPSPPATYEAGNPLRYLMWYFRNPFHNFTFYVIGVADHADSPDYDRTGTYPTDNFAPVEGWNFDVIHYKDVELPFVSFWDHEVSFYIGWRNSGEFGIKINKGSLTSP